MDEKLYLKCDECGEVFDEIPIAYEHIKKEHPMIWDAVRGELPVEFTIVPESEAF